MATACTSSSTSTSTETSGHDAIQKVKDIYGQNCRIITNVGEFIYVVNVKLYSGILTIKFQVSEDFAVDGVIIKCQHLLREQIEELEKVLTQSNPYAPLTTKIELCKQLIINKGIDLEAAECPAKEKRTPKTKNKKSKTNQGEAEKSTKKPSLKTAENVLDRIFWDPALDVEDFIIGYMDRFLGVLEKPVTAFSWEDIASVDYDTLAIPKHRIQYFKYKGLKVWDKNERLDQVFGSCGGNRTIYDVITMLEQQEEEAIDDVTPEGPGSDDEDDDVEITCNDEEAEDEMPDHPDGTRKLTKRELYWGPKMRPTHFLALRIDDPEIIAAVEETQQIIAEINPDYESSMTPLTKLHVTLCCLGLDDDQAVGHAVDTLHRLNERLQEFNPQNINLKFEGVGDFFGNCLYARVTECEPEDCKDTSTEKSLPLEEFVQNLHSLIEQEGVSIRNVFDFVPHMTLFKMRRELQSQTRTHYMDTRITELLKDKYFGTHTVDNIHLCVMSQDKQSDGFYVTPTLICFN